MNILLIEYSNEFHSFNRNIFGSSSIQHAFYTQTIQVCPRQWEHVCNSGRVLFGSENYQNDRCNSCHSMNILFIEYSNEFQSCQEMYLSLLDYSMLFIHKQSRFVRDSGSMSATVDGCSLGVKTIKMIGLTHVIA